MILALILAAISVTPAYTNVNRAGGSKIMTNIEQWAPAVEAAIGQGGGGEANSITNVFTNGVSAVSSKMARIAIPDVSRKRDVSDMYSPLLGGGDFGIRGFVVGTEPVESGQEVDVDTEYDGKVGTETRWRFKDYVPYKIGVAYADDGSWEVSAYIRNETLDVVGITETKHPFQRIRFNSDQGPFYQDIWIVFDRIATVNGVSAITNGLCTVKAAQAMTNDQAIVRTDRRVDQILTVNGMSGIRFENVDHNGITICGRDIGTDYTVSLPGKNGTLALESDIPNAYTRTQSDARYAPTGTAVTVASHASQLSQLSQSIDYSTNNTQLVSTITNLAPSKAKGVSLRDPVRNCSWYAAVTNGVFYWMVEE